MNTMILLMNFINIFAIFKEKYLKLQFNATFLIISLWLNLLLIWYAKILQMNNLQYKIAVKLNMIVILNIVSIISQIVLLIIMS